MIKSNKCDYQIGSNKVVKKKYLTPQLAIKKAEFLNSLLNVIKRFKPYKCTVCHFFHVGRSQEDIEHEKNIFKEELIIEEIKPVQIIAIEKHDDFDWTTDKRLI